MKTAIVTGASSGIGREIAKQLISRRYDVIGTSRNSKAVTDRLQGVRYCDLDLTDQQSIDTFVSSTGQVNVLVNNAGESQCGPLEELPTDAIARLFQLNVLGPIELTQRLLPRMRAQRSGTIVNVGSMQASFPLAYRSSYVATKAALRGFSTAARHELKPFGIDITTVEPGSIDTGLSTRRTKYCASDSPYVQDFETVISMLDKKEGKGITADEVATTVMKAIDERGKQPLYAVGSHAPVVFAAQRLLPRRIVESMTAAAYGLAKN